LKNTGNNYINKHKDLLWKLNIGSSLLKLYFIFILLLTLITQTTAGILGCSYFKTERMDIIY